MAIKNLDRKENEKVELQQNISNALQEGDSESTAKALTAMANHIQDNIINEAKSIVNDGMNDQQVLSTRGVHVLTQEEKAYYNEVIDNSGFIGVEKLVPKTVIDRVFEDLKQNHQLLNHIDFVDTTGITQWVMKNGEVNSAFWGKLGSNIQELLDDGFKTIDMHQFKLSAFIPVSNDMLQLGVQWLDKYVRTVLVEAIAIALEEAIVKGSGADQPIGMLKNLEGGTDANGAYYDKAATPISDLSPKTLGSQIMAPLTKGGKRSVSNVLLVVNPLDYWGKVYPETTVLTDQGTYAHGVLPIPATVVQSVAVPQNQMVVGLGKDYFVGVGSERKIESSKHARFIEDQTVYLSRMLANGQPKDNESFLLFDITNVAVDEATTGGTTGGTVA